MIDPNRESRSLDEEPALSARRAAQRSDPYADPDESRSLGKQAVLDSISQGRVLRALQALGLAEFETTDPLRGEMTMTSTSTLVEEIICAL